MSVIKQTTPGVYINNMGIQGTFTPVLNYSDTINYLLEKLNNYLASSYTTGEKMAVLSSLTTPDGAAAINIENKLVVSVINVEQLITNDTIPADQPFDTDIHLVLYANFNGTNYPESIKLIEMASYFFKFNFSEAYHMPTHSGEWLIERVNLGYAELNGICALLGVHYRPLLVYHVKTINGYNKYINSLPVDVEGTDKPTSRQLLDLIETNVKQILMAYVFAPNTESTWSAVRYIISSYLYKFWKIGRLKGGTSEDAYRVQIGLGTTMTGDDILNGLLNLTIQLAMENPAEFTEITFQQQMQKS